MLFKKFKSSVAALLVIALLISCVSFALAADYPFAATLKTSGTLRKSASESSSALAVLPAGDAVYVTGESGNYYIVEYDGASATCSRARSTLPLLPPTSLPKRRLPAMRPSPRAAKASWFMTCRAR